MPKRLHELGQPIAACEVYVVRGGKVLMHKRSEDKKKFPGFWIGPGGHIDEGEDALTAAIREVEEETGVVIQESDVKLKVLAFHHHLDREEVWMEYLFRASIDVDQPVVSNHEGESEWVEIERLMKMDKVFEPSKYYFEHILLDKPGIMYNSSQWSGAKLVKVLSERVDGDY